MGDASMTAFYRLGIGINSAFTAVREFGDHLDEILALSSSGIDPFHNANIDRLQVAVSQHEQRTQKRVKELVQYQLSTMFYGMHY